MNMIKFKISIPTPDLATSSGIHFLNQQQAVHTIYSKYEATISMMIHQDKRIGAP
jgi:hypothetical protein